MSKKAWGGRFETDLDTVALDFSASVDVDARLAREDIEGSLAHAEMLTAQGVLCKAYCTRLTAQGLLRKAY